MSTTTEKKNYTLPIIVMFLLFFMISFVTGFQNPFGVILKNQLSLSTLQSQLGNAANFIAYAFMGLPAGIILQNKGYKFSAIAAVIVGLAGVAVMMLSSILPQDTIFGVYLVGAFIAGFSMCMLNTVVNPMLNTLGGGGKKGNQLIQFGGSLNSIGATICPVLVGYCIGDAAKATLAQGRLALLLAMGVFFIALVVLIFSKLPEPQLEEMKKEARKDHESLKKEEKKIKLSNAFAFSNYLFGVIAIFFYVGIEVGIPNIANLYMTTPEIGIEASAAGMLCGMYWLLMMVGRFVGGTIGGKISAKTMLTAVSSVALVLLACAILCDPATKISIPAFDADFNLISVQAPINILFLVLCGLCTSIMWGGIFNLAVEGLGEYTAVASGFFMVMVCGGGIVPLIQGYVADIAGYLSSYWVLFAGVAYLLFYALIGSRVTKRA